MEWVRGHCIGKGSFGTVSLATAKSTGRIFAVKSVELRTAVPLAVECLENEIRILKSLASPYIVRCIGDDWTCESPAMAPRRNLHMEYVPGGTLADAASNAELEEHVIRSYTRCILHALHQVHSKGIVHCDVKGRNVLVGPAATAKLADFGAARRISSVTDPDGLSSMGGTWGTPLWMAPEVSRQERPTPASDVWSLGCTIIEMATGKPPWRVENAAAAMFDIGFCNKVPEFPTRLSELGRDFLDKCLRRRPSERWTCKRLLKHPFVADGSAVSNSSPRSVLNWIDTEFEDKTSGDANDDNAVSEEITEISVSNHNYAKNVSCSAMERIRSLASDKEIDWDSEGWEVVRPCTVLLDSGREEATSDGEERERIGLEYSNSCSSCYCGGEKRSVSNSGGMSCVMSCFCWYNISCFGLLKAGFGCQYGYRKWPLGQSLGAYSMVVNCFTFSQLKNIYFFLFSKKYLSSFIILFLLDFFYID